MTKFDYRTKEGREGEVLAQIAIDGGLSIDWANEVPQRRAAVNRLQHDERIRLVGRRGDFLRFEIVDRRQQNRSFFQLLDSLIARFA